VAFSLFAHRVRDAAWYRLAMGRFMQGYLTTVWRTSRFVIEPFDFYDRLAHDVPAIMTFWHGQHFMAPFLRRDGFNVKALISFHRDADINAIAAERLGVGTIRGSGDPGRRFDRKGGVRAFVALRQALRDGYNVAMTGDVPKIARVASRGLVMLAQASGRPIYPVGLATSRRMQMNNWDRTAVNLPFSRGAFVFGEPISVPGSADDAMIEVYRRQVEDGLNAVDNRAYQIVSAPDYYSSPPLADQSMNVSGRATASSDLRSAATPQRQATRPPAIISAAPSK
jgi:hypothetical protein